MIAKAIHAELGNTQLVETNGEMLSNPYELISLLVSATENTSIFVDEAQGMSQRSMHIWLSALSERVVYIPQLGSNRKRRVIPLENFCTLMATTHEYCLQDALRNRFRIYCRFEYYSLDDLVGILRQRCQALGWEVESEDVLLEIAKRSKKLGIVQVVKHNGLVLFYPVFKYLRKQPLFPITSSGKIPGILKRCMVFCMSLPGITPSILIRKST